MRISENNRNILEIVSISRKLLGVIMIGSVLCTILIAYSMTRAMGKPINVLVAATRQVAQGHLRTEISVESADEIGELSESFNSMIRDLRLQKTELVKQKDYVDSIISSMAESLIVTSPEGRIKTVNRATCDLLGYSSDELIGKDINSLFADEEEEDILFPEDLMTGHGTKDKDYGNYELAYKHKDGRPIPVLFSASGLRNERGNVTGLICVAQDITGIKRAETELRSFTRKLSASNRELQHFLHIATHDLQEPLRKVKVFGDRLMTKYHNKLDGTGQHYIDRMLDSTVRMQTLIHDLLTLSHITTRAQPFEEVDLASLAREVIDDLSSAIDESEGSIEVGYLPVIYADPRQMRQLFRNLIGNSLKFRSPDRTPVIRLSGLMLRDNGGGSSQMTYCRLIFEDNGIGFDPRHKERIFGVFQRLHGRNEYTGTGIGLSICRKIAERHGGTMAAQGIPGQGASIVVTLPLGQPEAVATISG